MAGYFSFRKLITPYFVKPIYGFGFIVFTAGGIGLAVGAGMRLNSAQLPTRIGIYYIVIGAGAVIVGNVVWRMICEFWLLRFRMCEMLASIEREVKYSVPQREAKREIVVEKPTREKIEERGYEVAPSRGVLGLS